jgi:hypothetical protein
VHWPIAENNPHNAGKKFAKKVCELGKNCGNHKGKCHSVPKVLTATLIYFKRKSFLSSSKDYKNGKGKMRLGDFSIFRPS